MPLGSLPLLFKRWERSDFMCVVVVTNPINREEKEYLSKSINSGGNELKKGKKRHKLCWVWVPKIRENNLVGDNSNRRISQIS